MEYIAGFYVALGILIIIFKSEPLKNLYSKAFKNHSGKKLKASHLKYKPSYKPIGKMVLEKVPVR